MAAFAFIVAASAQIVHFDPVAVAVTTAVDSPVLLASNLMPHQATDASWTTS